MPRSTRYDAVVIGAGLIGLACAWRAEQQGLSVLVVDRGEAGRGASGVAAGMLAPVTEADFGEDRALGLLLAGRERWPAFAAELEERTGVSPGFRACGALVVATDRDDVEELQRLHRLQLSLGLEASWLSPAACRRAEGWLAPRVAGGVLAATDAQADPSAVIRALVSACGEVACGVNVHAIEHHGARVTGLRTSAGAIECEQVVLAAGAWSASVAPGARPPVRPVKGQILELKTRARGAEPLARIVRTPRCYIVGRGDGRVVVGATVEEQGFDTTVTAGGVQQLLEAAWEAVPEVGELELVAARAGLRPATPDNRPVVGRDELDGVIWATGHWRNGVLLAPVTADLVSAALTGEAEHPLAEGLSPARFSREGAAA